MEELFDCVFIHALKYSAGSSPESLESYSIICYDCHPMAKHKVIIPAGLKPFPARYELSAATLLADYFKVDVEFVLRSNQKTPDFLIDGAKRELKSPTGTGKRNIERQLQAGIKQSQNIVFDARRSKIHIAKIRNELNYQFRLAKSIKRIVLIEKSRKIVELVR